MVALFVIRRKTLFLFQLFQSAAELVGARGGLPATADAVEFADDIVNLLTHHQGADALQVAVAALDEIHLLDDIIIVSRHVNQLRASTLRLILNVLHKTIVYLTAKIGNLSFQPKRKIFTFALAKLKLYYNQINLINTNIMRSKHLLLMLLLALIIPIAADAQEELTVYEGTETNMYVPAYVYYFDEFTRSQFVIPANELDPMNGATINEIKFYTTNANIPYTSASTVDVYLMEVNYTTINAFEPKANGSIVYQGTLSFVSEGTGGSLTISFDNEYTYNGGNLLVGIENTTAEGYKKIYFYGQEVEGASVANNDENSLNNVQPAQQNFIPKTTFTYSGGVCSKPTSITIVDPNSNSALVNWTGGSGTYNVQYKKAVDAEWTDRVTNYSGGSGLVLSNLASNTAYQVRVQCVCEGNTVSGWKTTSFNTLAGLPFFEEFTSYSTPLAWETHHGLLSDIMGGETWASNEADWYFGSSSNGVFDKHARINLDGSYVRDWIVTPSIAMESGVKLSFDLALTSYSGSQSAPETNGTDDRFVVLISTNDGDTWTILREWNNTGSPYVFNNIAHTAYGQTETIDLDAYYEDNIRIAFYAESTVENADNNLHLDNVSLDWCGKPSNFLLTEAGMNSATFNWTSTAGSHQIILNDGSEDHTYNTSTNPPYTIPNLTPGVMYTAKLRAYCGNQHSSQWTPTIEFITPFCLTEDQCQITYTLEDRYEDSWNGAAINVVDVVTSTIFATLTIEEGSSASGVLNVCNGREIRFDWVSGSYDDECSYAFYDINGELIFEGEDAMNQGVLYTVDCTITDCRKPTNFEVSDVANRSATLWWTENGEATEWIVAYKPEYATEFTEVTANENPYSLTGLVPETEYTVKVRPACSDLVVKWSNEEYFVTDVPCSAPTDFEVYDVRATRATASWKGTTDSYDVRYGVFPNTSVAQEWLTYGVDYSDLYGSSSTLTRTWGTLYPASEVTGNVLTKVEFYEASGYNTKDITIKVYSGGDDAPNSLLYTETITPLANGLHVVTLSRPVYITPGENLWITLTETGTYTLACGPCDDDNNRWILSGNEWTTWSTGVSNNLGWIINGYMETINLESIVWTTDTTTDNSYLIEDVDPVTTYLVQVRANCGGEDGSSTWIGACIETLVTCADPTNLQITEIATTTAYASWTGGADNYDIRYGQYPESTNSTWLTYNVTPTNNYGSQSSSTRTWGVLYPASRITGNYLTRIKYSAEPSYLSTAITVNIYSSGDNAPGTLLYTQEVTPTTNGWNMVTLFEPVNVPQGENLWITFTATGTHILRSGNCNDDNNRWIISGNTWTTWTTGVNNNLGWTIEGYLETLDFGTMVWTTDTTTETNYPLTNLQHETSYIFQVRSQCDGNHEWVSAYFTTDEGLVFVNDGNWNEGANWYLGTVPADNSDVRIEADAIIPAGYDAKVSNITLNGGSITIKDGGQLHSNVDVQATVEKSITGFTGTKDRYYLISNPVSLGIDPSDADAGLTTGTYDLYYYDGDYTEEEWRNYKKNPFDLTDGIGYLYANDDDVTLRFTGTVRKQRNNLLYNNVELTYDEDYPIACWNLVGNMFPHNAYVYMGYNNEGQVEYVGNVSYYKMNDAGDELIAATNEVVKPCEGIFIQSTDTDQYAYFSSKQHNVTQTRSLNLNLIKENSLVDRALIRFDQGNSLEKFQLNPNHTKLYIPQDNKDYAVVYSQEKSGEMPVSFKAENNGSYTLSFNTENVEFGYLHLIDNMTGEDVNLLETPSYSFEAKTTDYASRFKLVFSTGNGVNDESFAFISDGNIIVNAGPSTGSGTSVLQVVDVIGRIMIQEENATSVSTSGMTPGVYVLRLINGDSDRTQKIVVK